MARVLFFDCVGVLYINGQRDQALLDYILELKKSYQTAIFSSLSSQSLNTIFTQDEQQLYFGGVVISRDSGLLKPDLRGYVGACQTVGVAPREAVVIDDSPANCDGAVQAGMRAILYKNISQLRADLQQLS